MPKGLSLELVVWNSQGGKWDTFWSNYVNPLDPSSRDIVGLLVESGWAPWVKPGEIWLNHEYDLDSGKEWFDLAAAKKSALCKAVMLKRNRKAFWVPWAKNFDLRVNTRCSMGAVLLGHHRTVNASRYDLTQKGSEHATLFTRPVGRFDVNQVTVSGDMTEIVVFLVHLVSGYKAGAAAEMEYLTKVMTTLIPQGTAAFIVGDMNIDLLTTSLDLPRGWSILDPGRATQQSGGLLDYALVYDPKRLYSGAKVEVVEQYKSGNNQSDHSVLQYTIPLVTT